MIRIHLFIKYAQIYRMNNGWALYKLLIINFYKGDSFQRIVE